MVSLNKGNVRGTKGLLKSRTKNRHPRALAKQSPTTDFNIATLRFTPLAMTKRSCRSELKSKI